METTTVVPQKKQKFVVEDEVKKRIQGRHEEEEEEGGDDDFEETFGAGRCFGFDLFCFKSNRHSTRDYGMLQQDGQGGDDQFHSNHESNWFVKRGKKLREISELIAGPKWKTFIRKIGYYCNNGKNINRKRMNTVYDAHSYALNFDDGNEEKVFDGHR
ncbi:hypothetical protein MKW94_013576 [Papaver nudicaule]|uniref:Stress induced protein n=1 Tax=Papaver nudicaule TaxID=74823 RepID=A0AA41UX94_PAPNU|nr:hypothetical protein [Papaver nudicaule]